MACRDSRVIFRSIRRFPSRLGSTEYRGGIRRENCRIYWDPFPGPEKATCLARKQWRPATGCRSGRSIRFKRSREIACEIECNLDLASSVDEGCHQASFACHRSRQGALSQKEVGRVFEKKGTHTPSFDLPSRRVTVSLNRRPMLAHPSHRSKGTFLTLCIAVHQIGNPI